MITGGKGGPSRYLGFLTSGSNSSIPRGNQHPVETVAVTRCVCGRAVRVASRLAASVRLRSGGMQGAEKGTIVLSCEALGWGNRADRWTEEGQQPGSPSAADD